MHTPDLATNRFTEVLAHHGVAAPNRGRVTTLQVNVGFRCDLACLHCHVEAGPKRTEALDARGAERILEVLEHNPGVTTLDLTGGAPELNPHFRALVRGARALDREVIDRCNLTVLLEPGQEDTAAFLAEQRVRIVASLPCTSAENVDRQRGRDVFSRSIDALRQLNALGYGRTGSELVLDLVYNPTGPFLPPPQGALAERYHRELRDDFGIEFNELITITNMPIKRFARDLAHQGAEESYQALLADHFNAAAVPKLMCRETLSVGHDGRLYDCDFNQMLSLPLGGEARTLWDVLDLDTLRGHGVATASHCLGCTAGNGSSCSGALT